MNPTTSITVLPDNGCGYPRMRKMTKWGPAHTVRHSKGSNKARWVVRLFGGGLRYEHDLVWEEANGRKLRPGEHVHHIDEDPLNNDPKNLRVLTIGEHNSRHKLRNMNSHIALADGGEGKHCPECSRDLPLVSFSKNGRSQAGTPVYRPRCTECEKAIKLRRTLAVAA